MFLNTHMTSLMLNPCSNTSCHRTVQFIRAQVQKQSPKRSNRHTQVKFSLSGRDGDSNRFLPSWGFIPNTHPINLINGCLGSPLVQLRNRGSEQPRTLRESTLPGGQSHLGLMPMAPRTSLLPPGCAVSLLDLPA